MTVQEALREGYSILRRARVKTPFLDATVLLSEACSCSKEQLYRGIPEDLNQRTYPGADASAYEVYSNFLKLRCRGLPVSYIRQKKEFFSLEFRVDDRVFVPRPDTECLIEVALELVERFIHDRAGVPETSADRPVAVHDVCSGSGCIAITIKHECPSLSVTASDLSEAASELFEINSRLILDQVLPFSVSDLFDDVTGPFDVIVSNPPYLRTEVVSSMRNSGWPEPLMALDGGADGTELPIRLIRDAVEKLLRPGYLALEADPHQMECLSAVMRYHHFDAIRIAKDLTGRNRVISGRIV